MTQTSIMVVEDEIIIGLHISETLTNLGYEVSDIITSGEEAIEQAAEIKPDLILMDIMLSGSINGIKAAKQIRDSLNIPIVYLTAHTDRITLNKAKETQPFGYIVKPFTERELHTTIEMALTRHKAETDVRNALEKEKELNQLKSRFVSMVSHEFRTPLFTILFSAGLIEKYRFQWTEDKKLTHIQRIQAAAQEMTHLLQDVLIIGQAEAGKIEFNPAPLDLKKMCSEIAEEMQFSVGDRHQIIYSYSEESSEKLPMLDAKLLRHIISNLLSNAIKYSPEGENIRFEVMCDRETVRFQIQDRGIGIPPEDQKRLFEPFHRATNVSTISGTGLGLTIVKRSVDLHGGQIDVQSEVGVGTTFRVTLPISNQENPVSG
ncbi:MAG TPA: ATP-binding protein [Candidatus Obscuribacterales bacterium]